MFVDLIENNLMIYMLKNKHCKLVRVKEKQ